MPSPGTILALDTARTTGWCCGVPGERPHYGAVTFNGPSHGAVYGAFCDWVEDAIRLHKPREIVVESPLHRGGHLGQDAALLAFGFLAHLELLCHDHAVRLMAEHVQTSRKNVIGRGNFAKGTAKQAVMDWCRAQGFNPPTHDAADAIVLWLYASQLRLGKAA
jgi:Holliday junction resolvasome RuvABC endonuclease subunit